MEIYYLVGGEPLWLTEAEKICQFMSHWFPEITYNVVPQERSFEKSQTPP